MKNLKSFKSFKLFESQLSSSDLDDIKEFYIEFKDEWGFFETNNTHDFGENGCEFKFNDYKFWFIEMAFQIGSQDVDMCYRSLIEMSKRIMLLNSDFYVRHEKYYSDIGNLFLAITIMQKRTKYQDSRLF
jgi:hypothetical protein